MKNTLVAVADLGCLKAYRVDANEHFSTPRLELVEEFHPADAPGRLVEKVSDLSGRFPRSSGPGGSTAAMSAGERHNILLEQRKRLVRQLAARLNALTAAPDIQRCLLAASKEIHHLLLEALDPRARSKIHQHLPADLTKVEKSELLRHFQVA